MNTYAVIKSEKLPNGKTRAWVCWHYRDWIFRKRSKVLVLDGCWLYWNWVVDQLGPDIYGRHLYDKELARVLDAAFPELAESRAAYYRNEKATRKQRAAAHKAELEKIKVEADRLPC